eukprot:7227832-Pyramimonas_sp.AAC.1
MAHRALQLHRRRDRPVAGSTSATRSHWLILRRASKVLATAQHRVPPSTPVRSSTPSRRLGGPRCP